MHPFNKPLSELVLADIDALIQNGISEGRTLDYKRDLYGGNDAEKKEFLCDVSAFANTVGGYLIIGVDEDKGVPKAITPVAIEDTEKLQLHFENLLRMAVDPPIRGVDFQAIDAGDGKKVVVVEIPRSISRPHAVNHKGHWRFYGRNSIGKYPYEVDDVRRAMLQSETLAVRIRSFRNDRLSQISVGETPVPVPEGAKIVLHLMPVSSFDLGAQYDIREMSSLDIWPMHPGGCSHTVNLDGIVTFQSSDSGPALSYTQLFRNGTIEFVDAFILTCRGEMKEMPSGFETELVAALKKYRSTLATLGVGFPIWVSLSLLGVRRYRMVASSMLPRSVHLIDRDELILPEICMEDTDDSPEQVLKPAFDSIWNACGYERSMNYDKNGNWILKG